MEDKSEEQKLKEAWIRDAENRHKRRLKDHQMSREDMERRNASQGFQDKLELGKLSERYVAEKMINIKFDVRDISTETYEAKGLELHSPFDLLVSSQLFLFAVDVKRRNYRVPIGIPILKMKDYESYNKYDVINKLLVFHFPIRERHQDLFYMHIKDIKEMCHMVGPFYHIEIHQLTSLTQKSLLNTLEPTMTLSEILEKYERD